MLAKECLLQDLLLESSHNTCSNTFLKMKAPDYILSIIPVFMLIESKNWVKEMHASFKIYYSAIKKNTFESVLMRWMKLEAIIQSEVSRKKNTNTVY